MPFHASIPRRRRRSRPLTLFAILALVTMLLGPIAGELAIAQDGAQQDQEQQVEPTEVAPEPTAEPIATEAPPATEEPPPTEDLAVTEEPVATEVPAGETSQLTISVHRCDHPEFDPYFSENTQRVLETCTGPGTGTFSVLTPQGEQTQSGTSLTFTIDGLDAIQEALQPGYDDSIANCFIYDANGTQVDQIGPGETNGGSWRLNGAGGDVHCDWYQVDRGGGEVNILSLACPGTTALFPQPETLGEMLSQCTETIGKKQFFVVHGAGLERMGVVDSFGYLFEAIQTGPIEIWMDDPAGYDQARLFCRVTTFNGAEVSPFTEVSVSNFRASGITLVHRQTIDCRWFNIEDGPGNAQADDPTPTPDLPEIEPGGGSVAVNVHACPPGTNIAALDMYELASHCQDDPGTVNFNVANPDFFYNEDTTASGDGNYASFTEVATGVVTISGPIPVGFVTPVVYCKVELEIDLTDIVPTQQQPVNAAGSISMPLSDGQLIWCDWYIVPAGEGTGDGNGETVSLDASPEAATPTAAEGTGSIAVVTYTCPAGFDVDAVDQNPRITCPTTSYIEFDVDDTIDDGQSYTLTTDSGGLGTIADLPADTYTLSQIVPNGVTSSFVWDCYDTNTISDRTDPLATGGVVQTDLAEGMALRCDVFNVIGGVGRVVVSTHGCGTDVPSYVLDYAELLAQCTIDTGRIDFSVLSNDDTYRETMPASNNPLTLASFDSVPSGGVTIYEDLPGGWGTPIVYCQVLAANGEITMAPAPMEVVVGKQVYHDLQPGETLGCDWFNVTRAPLEVWMRARACPVDFDAYAYADQYGALEANCREETGPIEFSVHDGGLYLESRTVPIDTSAYWADAPSGTLTINETLPDGFGPPIVFCDLVIADAENNRYAVQGFVDVGIDSSIRYDAPPGQKLSCTWFNVPGDVGMVSFSTQACPPTLDVVSATRLELEQGCNEPIGAVDYALTSGSFSDATTQTDSSGYYADFPSVPSGDITARQGPGGDYSTAVVFCSVQEDSKVVTRTTEVPVSGDRAINYPVEAGQWLICEWYLGNTPEGSVIITKWECPEPIPASQERTPYQEKCTRTRDGVEFTVTGIASSSTQVTANGGTAQWTDIQPGLVTITEHIPQGYGEPVVFCTAPKVNRNYPVTNGTIEHELYEGGYLHCDWFNIPVETGKVIVHKGECPEGTTRDHDAIWYVTNCDTPMEGVGFTLTHEAGSVPGTTNATGTVEWLDVPLGQASLQEHIPAGYGDPVVYCTSEADRMLTGATGIATAAGGYVAFDLKPDAKEITCGWYNIPAGENSITIHKYTCPAGYDSGAWGAVPQQDCDEGPNGITFEVAGAATGITSKTGDVIPYAVAFEGLPIGTYTVTEQVPEEIATVFVWDCTGQRTGEQRPAPISTGPVFEIALDGDEHVTCHWYNVPTYEDDNGHGYGRITVIKYACTTEEFVSDIDCEIEERGVTFNLLAWDGDDWEPAGEETTDGAGRAVWTNLPEGEYWLDEQGGDWCYLASDHLAEDGNWLTVDNAEETVVHVYNCSSEPGGEPGKVPETPTKYPNTGVMPVSNDGPDTP